MKLKILSLALVSFSASAVLPAYAGDAARRESKQIINLQDGGTLYVFSDGKMAKENKYGHAEPLRQNTTLQSTDGKTLTVTSNEVARLDYLLREGHRGD